MQRAGNVNWQAIIALVLAVPVALVIVVTFSPFRSAPTVEDEPEPPRPRPKAKTATPATKGTDNRKSEPPLPVAPPPRLVLSPRETAAAKNESAHRGCQRLSEAIAAYTNNPANPGATERERLPQSVQHLFEPPFGGTSFLPNGKDDLLDPWGQAYEFESRKRSDGTEYVLVKTTARDGTPISQFGIGAESFLPNDDAK